jgi:ubiquitin-protein ligase
MEGPPNTPYAGGIFYLHIRYGEEYPVSPMQVRFVTPVWHPNVDEMGRICLDVLERAPGGWSPCLVLETALLSELDLLLFSQLLRSRFLGPQCLKIFRRSYANLLPVILARLSDPVVKDAINIEAASLFKDDFETFCMVAKMHTEEHATGVRPGTEELENFWGGGEEPWYSEGF